MPAYYNEIDPSAAAWLRNLIDAGLIPAGDVDERDIREVRAGDLEGYEQAHFFAGIGGWAYALRLAGWPDDEPVWTGSCPCQPLSSAGQRRGHADERHLWPAFHDLIAECRPATVFGEQVASRLGREWLSGVRADLEHLGYAVGGADMPAASVGAPHIRQRLWWVADARHGRGAARPARREHQERPPVGERFTSRGADGGLGNAALGRERTHKGQPKPRREPPQPSRGSGLSVGLGDPGRAGPPAPEREVLRGPRRRQEGRAASEPSGSFWSDAVLIPCADGKARRIAPGIQPLVDGLPVAVDGLGPVSRVGALRGAGNAIVPWLAAEFVRTVMGIEP